MADADLGSDFSALNDLDANLSTVSGRGCLMQALVRRVDTPRGALWYAQDYGRDLLAYLNTSTDPSAVEQAAEAEMLDDERVEDVDVTLTVEDPADKSITGGKSWALDLTLDTGDAPFESTVTVDALSGKVLLGGVG